MKTETCKQCSSVITDGKHPVNFKPLTADILDRLIKLKCSCCGVIFTLVMIKEQGIENWSNLAWTESCFCPNCSHLINPTEL